MVNARVKEKLLLFWQQGKIHLVGPIGSVIFHVLVLVVIIKFAVSSSSRDISNVDVTIITPVESKLDLVKPIEKEIERIKPDVPPDENPDIPVANPMLDAPNPGEADSGGSGVGSGSGIGSGDASLGQGFEISTLAKSPLIMRGLYANRTAGGREGAIKLYGGGRVGVGGGSTEDAVLRALRWLKAKQNPDGSWPGEEASAMTGLALLCYLAHGETPALSAEFGATVEKGMKYLMGVQSANGTFSGNGYANGIASYAMCESFAMTKIMPIKESMEKGLQVIIDGQQDPGGFDYNYKKGDRWDTSVSGWQFQAMKAGKMAGAQNPGLDGAIAKAVTFLKTISFNPANGMFSYSGNGPVTGPGGSWTMTGAGVLSLQLLGHGKDPAVKAGLDSLDAQVCKWTKAGADGKGVNAVYGWYYVTQAKFQEGGDRWDKWNKMFAKELVDNQFKDGHWEPGDHGKEVYTTTLCCLMLEVYYRYLPTYKKAEDAGPVTAAAGDDVKIDVK